MGDCHSDQIVAGGPDGCLGPVVYAEFVENMDHVAFYRVGAD